MIHRDPKFKTFQDKMQQVTIDLKDQFSDSHGVLGKLIGSAITDFHLQCNEAFLWDEFFALTRSPETD